MSNQTPVTEEQLAAARADLSRNPERAAWLAKAGISLEAYARSRTRAQQTLDARNALDARPSIAPETSSGVKSNTLAAADERRRAVPSNLAMRGQR